MVSGVGFGGDSEVKVKVQWFCVIIARVKCCRICRVYRVYRVNRVNSIYRVNRVNSVYRVNRVYRVAHLDSCSVGTSTVRS